MVIRALLLIAAFSTAVEAQEQADWAKGFTESQLAQPVTLTRGQLRLILFRIKDLKENAVTNADLQAEKGGQNFLAYMGEEHKRILSRIQVLAEETARDRGLSEGDAQKAAIELVTLKDEKGYKNGDQIIKEYKDALASASPSLLASTSELCPEQLMVKVDERVDTLLGEIFPLRAEIVEEPVSDVGVNLLQDRTIKGIYKNGKGEWVAAREVITETPRQYLQRLEGEIANHDAVMKNFLPTKLNGNGELVFTPAASREELERVESLSKANASSLISGDGRELSRNTYAWYKSGWTFRQLGVSFDDMAKRMWIIDLSTTPEQKRESLKGDLTKALVDYEGLSETTAEDIVEKMIEGLE